MPRPFFPEGASAVREDELHMRLALEEAIRAGLAGEVPVGAVVVGGGRVLGAGRNGSLGLCDPTGHAEILALRAAAHALGNYRLTGATLVATVEPCLMCLGAALHARISRVVFGARDLRTAGTERLDAMREAGAAFNHRFEVVGGVLGAEAAGLLVRFFEDRRGAGRASKGSEFEGEVPKWS